MTQRKKLIEVALPLAKINEESAREKSIRHGHPSTLHLWWARRPLAAARAVIFAQIVDDPASVPEEFPTPAAQERERRRLFRLIEEMARWENTTNERVLDEARAAIRRSWARECLGAAVVARMRDDEIAARMADGTIPPLPPFHDPFAGGGALPLEAQRLGFVAYASDLNPVAVLINKAMIEIPPRFAGLPPVNPAARADRRLFAREWRGAHGLAEDVRYYGEWMRAEAQRRIGHLYPPVVVTPEMAADRPDLRPLIGARLTVIAWLWARTVKSPNPAFAHVDVPLASTFVLSSKAGKEAYVEPIIDGAAYAFTVRVAGAPAFDRAAYERAKHGTKLARGANFQCVLSGAVINDPYIKAESMAGRMGARLMAIVAEGPRGRLYLPPTPEHEAIARSAQPEWKPDLPMNRDTSNLVSGRGYGFFTWADLFTPRQLVALTTFADLVGEAMERVKRDALAAWGGPHPSPPPAGDGPHPNPPPAGDAPHPNPPPPGEGVTPLPPAGDSREGGPAGGSREGVTPLPPAGGSGEGVTLLPPAGGGREGGPGGGALWSPTPVPPSLLKAARALRQNMTDAERLLWQCLRDKRMAGFRFRKQHPLERYVLDFYCPAARLAIEIDGGHHNEPDVQHRDAERTAWLATRGIRVLRFWNNDILNNIEGVLERIWEELHNSLPSPPPAGDAPHPSPPPAGDVPHPSPPPPGDVPLPSPPPPGEGVTPLSPAGGSGEGVTPLPPAGGGREGGPAGGGREGGALRDGGCGATAYAEAVGVYVGIALSRLTDICNALCRWEITKTQVRNLFARQAIQMVWDYAENNVFGEAAGDYMVSLRNMAKALECMPSNRFNPGYATQADAQTQALSRDTIISTDPPYYDNIGYADLSDFFYVWLRRALKPVFPDLFATVAVPKAEELVATPYRHGSKQAAERFFMEGMTKALQNLAAQAHPAFPVTIYYAFKQQEMTADGGNASTGWETFLEAVIRAGFAITGTWPMRTELGNRQNAMETNALASSIVLVCRPRPATAPIAARREFMTALKAELPRALADLHQAAIAPTDLAQAAIGPGMAVFSRFAAVRDATGRAMPVREALALINQTLDETLAEQEGEFDAATRWALAWFAQHGFAEGEFGEAETLSKAKNTSVEAMVGAGIVESKRGKVRLLLPNELPAASSRPLSPRDAPRLQGEGEGPVWAATHRLIHALDTGGEQAAAALVARLGSRADSARDLAYRLYAICERKQRAAEALAYNGLVQSWSEVVRLAAETSAARSEQTTFL